MINNQTTLFVGNLSKNVSEQTLGSLFQKYGQVVYIKLQKDPVTMVSKGRAFVTFATKESAEEAQKALNHTVLFGEG